MADDTAEVRLTAQTDPLKAGVQDAASFIERSFRLMREAINGFTAESRRSTEQVIGDHQKVAQSAGNLKDAVAGGFGAMGRVTTTLLGTVAALAGLVAVARTGIGHMAELKEEVRGLELSLGLANDKATQTAIALRLSGSSASAYSSMALNVGRAIRTQAEEFDRLGVAIRAANGDFLPLDRILQNIYTRMQDFKAGTDQQLFAMTLVGRSAKDFARDMENLNAVNDRAAELMRRLGIEMGEERQAQIEAYQVNMRALGLAFEQISVKIGELMLPAFVSFTTWIAGAGARGVEVFTDVIKGALSAFVFFGTGVSVVGNQIGIVVGAIARHFELLGDMIRALATGNLTGLANAVRATMANVQQAVISGVGDLATRLRDAKATLAGIWDPSKPGGIGGGTAAGGNERFALKPKGAGGSERDDRLAAMRDELRQLQEAEGYFREFSKAQEAQFWRDKLATIRGGGDAEVRLRREIARLAFDAAKADARETLATEMERYQRLIDAAKNDQAQQIAIATQRTARIKAIYGEESKEYERVLDQEIRLREQWVRREQELMATRTKIAAQRAEFEVEMERLGVDQAVAMRQVGAQRQLEIEQQLETKLYTIRRRLLEAQRDQYDARTREYAELTGQIERLEQDHQLKLTQISNAAARDRAQYEIAAAQQVQDAFSTLLQDITSGTKSAKAAMLDFFNSIAAGVRRLISDSLAKQLFGAGTSGGGLLSSLFGSLFGGVGGGGIGIGPGGLSLPGYASGTPYVPRDMVAVVHQGERIISAEQNRDGGGMKVTQHFAITGPVTAQSQAQIAAAAARGIQRGRRNL